MRLKKITTVLMAAAMCISGLTAVPADANAAASSSAASNTTRISCMTHQFFMIHRQVLTTFMVHTWHRHHQRI